MKVFNKKWIKVWKKLPKGLKYFTGVDPAIGTDFSLSFGIDKKGNIYIVRENEEIKTKKVIKETP